MKIDMKQDLKHDIKHMMALSTHDEKLDLSQVICRFCNASFIAVAPDVEVWDFVWKHMKEEHTDDLQKIFEYVESFVRG